MSNLKKAVDDIYKYPLKEFARETLSRQLKSGIDDDQLASLAISLREEDKLCIVNEDEQPNMQPQIICSLCLDEYLIELMALNIENTRTLLQGFDFKTLFIEELGWNNPKNK